MLKDGGREHDVELTIREGQVVNVSDPELDVVDAVFAGNGLRLLDHSRFDIDAHDPSRRDCLAEAQGDSTGTTAAVEEVHAGFEMLKALGLRHRGINLISCPSCARQQFEVIRTVELLEKRLSHITTPMTVSVIGCVVNGPGEARETDIGLTGGGNGTHMVYVNGIPDHKLQDEDILDHLVALIEDKAAEIEAAKASGDDAGTGDGQPIVAVS